MWRRWWWTCSDRTREAWRAASRFARRSRVNEIGLRQVPELPRTPRDHDGHGTGPAGRCHGPRHRLARAGGPARCVLSERAHAGSAEDGHRARPRAAERCQAAGPECDGGARFRPAESQLIDRISGNRAANADRAITSPTPARRAASIRSVWTCDTNPIVGMAASCGSLFIAATVPSGSVRELLRSKMTRTGALALI